MNSSVLPQTYSLSSLTSSYHYSLFISKGGLFHYRRLILNIYKYLRFRTKYVHLWSHRKCLFCFVVKNQGKWVQYFIEDMSEVSR